MNDQRRAILKAYELKTQQEVVLPRQQLISTYGPIRKESPKRFEKSVGGIVYSKPSDATKVCEHL